MLFHSATFLVFFLLFLPGFILLKGELRAAYTALASFIFYAWWYPPYLLLLAAFTLFTFLASRAVKNCSPAVYTLTLIACLLPLCFFKYTHFVLNNISVLTGRGGTDIGRFSLPLGISFITFTVIAYLVDIRRGHYAVPQSFVRVALYLSFFPHLIAGPIMRPSELFPQFKHLRLKTKLVKIGVFLFSIGLVKKMLFADTLSAFVDAAYQGSAAPNLVQSLVAFYAFGIQIYCDFSGYVDMALGLAFILGIRLPLNFNRPYIADSMIDFWRRWHMTLSRWLKDYLYIPLGGSRRGLPRMLMALMLTMVLGGLWHGAAWTFVLWGAYHGILLVAAHLSRLNGWAVEKWPVWLKRVLTLHLVCAGWILFRAKGLGQARHLAAGFRHTGDWQAQLGASQFAILLIGLFAALHAFDRVSFFCWLARRQRATVIYGVSIAIIVASMALSVGNPNAFIYFDF